MCCYFKRIWAAIATLQSNTPPTYTEGDGIDIAANAIAVDSTVARKNLTLAQFTATTSAELATLLTNETGLGVAVFNDEPTLINPHISGGLLAQSTGLVAMGISGVALSVNYPVMTNSITGVGPTITVNGGDTNADLNLSGKGTGLVKYKTYELGWRNIPFTTRDGAAYGLVKADEGKGQRHTSADASARVWTIGANSVENWTDGAVHHFRNNFGAGVITIAVTTDTMRLAGVGTTGSRTLAAAGMATAVWDATSSTWLISGSGLT